MNEDSQQATLSPLRCLECLREWTDPRERWRMYVTADRECGIFCSTCAALEFDD